ncbi:MAG: formate dehydrogenase accessory sulfurtransferase FdhD [Verrucomicrobia bacterium]|nr:MAG: formate dehydrogenase accessory sulfurtransferase FdhD [Verrucomicrobiota bacterium]
MKPGISRESQSTGPTEPVTRVVINKVDAGGSRGEKDDLVATEEPLEIRVDGRSLAVLMRTPGRDRTLAAGFLCSEGLVHSPDAIMDITRCAPRDEATDPNTINVTLDPAVEFEWDRLKRNTFASSSCGVCGKATIDSIRLQFPTIAGRWSIRHEVVSRLPGELRKAQGVFDQTGGLHAAGLFDCKGRLTDLHEDVGRHNAVDKLIGTHFLQNELPLNESILLLSGRVSFEVMQKALSAGIPVVAAISAPTSLAISFARESGQTLIGFLRDNRMNIYAHPERIERMEDG